MATMSPERTEEDFPRASLGRRVVFGPIGQCIYCGTTSYDAAHPDGRLAEEHVIPHGLGGNIVLTEASCRRCEQTTSAFEGTLQRTVFGPIRIAMGLPTRRPKVRPSTVPVSAWFSDGMETTVEIEADIAPLMCMLPRMNPPRLLGAPDGGDKIMEGTTFDTLEYLNYRLEVIRQDLGAVKVQVNAYVDMPALKLTLAKVAHATAVASAGLGGFHAFLPEIICRRDSENLDLYVGSCRAVVPFAGYIHHTAVRVVERGKQRLIVVEVGLFRRYGLPCYQVVAGRLFRKSDPAMIPQV